MFMRTFYFSVGFLFTMMMCVIETFMFMFLSHCEYPLTEELGLPLKCILGLSIYWCSEFSVI
jgi:hypothetical protein